jgi:hypothetical protein
MVRESIATARSVVRFDDISELDARIAFEFGRLLVGRTDPGGQMRGGTVCPPVTDAPAGAGTFGNSSPLVALNRPRFWGTISRSGPSALSRSA